ncbi:hypothetical protein OAT67_08595 [Bacteriovoracaceae bacterium]|nr:hypothetical protein [Bacteriovoracaceae bacterium]
MKNLVVLILIFITFGALAQDRPIAYSIEGRYAGIDWKETGTSYCKLSAMIDINENDEEVISIKATHKKKKVFTKKLSVKKLQDQFKNGQIDLEDKLLKSKITIKIEDGYIVYYTISSAGYSLFCSKNSPSYFFDSREN